MNRRKEEKKSAVDEFDSPWRNTVIGDESIPGDAFGHLSLAFLVADMVGSMQANGADHADIDALNDAFRNYRTAVTSQEVHASAESFKRTLETLSGKHDYLVSRGADLQSRVDDQQRALALGDFNGDVPS